MSDEKLKIGVMTRLHDDIDGHMRQIAEMGLQCVQIQWPAFASLTIATLWAGLPGPAVWNFVDGPVTIGLVPPEYRFERVKALQHAAQIASAIGVPSITTHCGFIPSNPRDPLYIGTVIAIRQVAQACQAAGVEFWFETGQETPVTLLRTIEDVGTDNLGINLDPANLLMYGNGNPIDALDVFGKYVKGTHCKDGEYPTDGRELGKEKPLGEGRVNFPVLIPKLKSLGFRGDLVIEREISGPQQIEDIKRAMAILEPLR